jgi:hypothetical protein
MPFKGGDAPFISFSSATFGVAISFMSGGVSRTTDGGATWAILDTIGITPQAVRNVPGHANVFLAVGQDLGANGLSLCSRDSGNSWIPLSAPTQSSLGDVSSTEDIAWAVGAIGTIFTLDIDSIVTSEKEIATTFPRTPFLTQNYPNPFNPSTTIRYALPERSHVTLAVFNTLGQQVATLAEGEREAGYHEVKFDASSLASGVYLYRLTAGDYVQARKLILLR